jgi:hypothetical protein
MCSNRKRLASYSSGSLNQLIKPLKALDDSWDDLARHLFAVLDPVFLVLVRAPRVISPRSIEQQNRQVEGIEVRQRMREQRGDAPEERCSDLRNVVEVSVEKERGNGTRFVTME